MNRHLNRDATLEDLTFLADVGVGATEAARRLDFTSTKTLDKYLRRQGRSDLILRLIDQDYWPITTKPMRGLQRRAS